MSNLYTNLMYDWNTKCSFVHKCIIKKNMKKVCNKEEKKKIITDKQFYLKKKYFFPVVHICEACKRPPIIICNSFNSFSVLSRRVVGEEHIKYTAP